jgi:hypothetical protein
LSRRARGPAHHGSDLVEGHVEHVVEDECQPLGGRQHFEYRKQREPDRVSQLCLMLGIDPLLAADDWIGDVYVQRLLAPYFA